MNWTKVKEYEDITFKVLDGVARMHSIGRRLEMLLVGYRRITRCTNNLSWSRYWSGLLTGEGPSKKVIWAFAQEVTKSSS